MSDQSPEVDYIDVVLEDMAEEVKTIPPVEPALIIDESPPQYIDNALEETEVQMLINRFDPVDTVNMTNSPFSPSPTGNDPEKAIATLLQGLEEIEEVAEKYQLDFTNNDQDAALTPQIRRVKAILGTLIDTLQTKYFQNIDSREGSDWGQGMEHGGSMFGAGKPKLAANADPVLRIRNELGLGSLIQIPCWRSGIWITLRAPSDAALLELEQRLGMEKATLGRSSNGLIFSNTEVYTKNHLIDFILDHVYSVTAESKEPAFLRSILLDADYPQLVWGIALASFPAGYPLIQPCIATPESCSHVVEALINLSRISWLDRSRLSTTQRIHMLNRVKASTIVKIEEYQKEFNANVNGDIKVSDTISLRMRVPTLEESRNIGFSWVEQILNATQKAFGMRMADGARENYVQQQAMLTSLRQYGQWFDAVIKAGGVSGMADDEVITDRESVDEIITMIASSNELSTKIYKAVKSFINDSTVSMIALPKYKCPACQGEPEEKYLLHPKLIPLDVVQVFFTLRDQKVTRRLGAEMNRYL
jgi:hypothetical protein